MFDVRELIPFPLAQRGPLEVLELPGVSELGVDAFITTRHGGVSDGPFATLNLSYAQGDEVTNVRENEARVAEALGVATLRRVRQTHSSIALRSRECAADVEADAIITSDVDDGVAIIVADCTPLLIVSPASHQLAVVHAGWRGLAGGVVENTLAMVDGERAQLRVFVGPGISGETYQVGPEVVAASPYFAANAVADTGDRSLLNTRGAAVDILYANGVTASNIIVSSQTTDGATLFFSDRAQRPCGRFALVAKWQS